MIPPKRTHPADDYDADSDVDPTVAIGDDILNGPSVYDGAAKDADAGIALDELSSGDESSGSDAEDGNGPPKSSAQRRADAILKQQDSVRSIKRNVKKLDVVMQVRSKSSSTVGKKGRSSDDDEYVLMSHGGRSYGRRRGGARSGYPFSQQQVLPGRRDQA
ncbi:unnamed protein product [Tilletia caries]|nr:unnamed protein product [Tilletia caries]